MRALKITGAALAAVIIVIVPLLVIGIPSGFLTSEIQSRVEQQTGYRLTIAGSTRIGLWPTLNVTLNDITLQDPKDRDATNRVTVGSVQADITLASLWAGHPQVTELVIRRPVLAVPLLRERSREPSAAPRTAASSGGSDANAPSIERVTVTDGSIVFSNQRDRVNNRIDGINVDVGLGADRKIKLTGSARAGEHPLKFDIRAALPTPPIEHQNVPVELTFEAPGMLQAPLSGKAEARLTGSVVMINGVTGTLGDAAFNGWASVDFSSKPLVKVDLDFQRLEAAVTKPSTEPGTPQAPLPWSDAPINLTGLNYVDAQIRISAAELDIGQARLAPVSIDAALAGGVLRCTFSNMGAYGGQASGQVLVDASTGHPTYALSSDLVGVRALPILQSAADFDKLDGKMQAKLAVRSAGDNQRAIMSNLTGTVFVNFQDGEIRGLNVAQMIRSLTASTLSGWQEGREQTTDMTQLSASFRLDKGRATSTDFNLVGPLVRVTGAGTIDLGAKALAFRVEPKLVMTTEGQGRATDPVGLGIPVMIEGPWSAPRIYPDMNGILDNPDAAYAKLKDMGKGLFGANGGGLGALGGLGSFGGLGGNGSGSGTGSGSGNGSGNGQSDLLGGNLGQTLGNLLQQGLGSRAQNRSIPNRSGSTSPAPAAPEPAPAPTQAQSDPPPQTPQDSQSMDDVLRRVFNH